MARIKNGDIIEIKTEKGFAYAQYSFKHKQYGSLLRVFNKTHAARPTNLKELVRKEPSFFCFFPLSATVDQKIVTIVDNEPLSEAAKLFLHSVPV